MMEMASLENIPDEKLRSQKLDSDREDQESEISTDKKSKSSQKQGIDRICCIRINRSWTIRKQLLVSMLIILTIVFFLLSGMLAAFLLVTRKSILDSIEKELSERIYINLKKSLDEFSKATANKIYSMENDITSLGDIFLNSYGESNSLWNPSEGEFPLLTYNDKFYTFSEGFPQEMQEGADSEKKKLFKEAEQVSYKTFSYQSFDSKEGANLSPESKVELLLKIYWDQFHKGSKGGDHKYRLKILESVGVLDYFFSSVYFDRTVKNLTSIYLTFEQGKLLIKYPGIKYLNKNYYPDDYDPTGTNWFLKIKESYLNSKVTAAQMSEPFYDELNNRMLVYLSNPLIGKNQNFIGVIGAEIIISDYEDVFETIKIDQRTKFYIVNANGAIMNDPLSLKKSYNFFEEKLTNFSLDDWKKISNKKDETPFFNIRGNIVVRSFIISAIPNFYYVILLVTPEESARRKVIELFEIIDSGFNVLLFIIIVSIASLVLLTIIMSLLFSERIVRPLTQLTNYAKRVNMGSQHPLTKEIHNNLDKIEATDILEDLIQSFKKLVKGLSLRNNSIALAAGNSKARYPKNFYFGASMPFRNYFKDIYDDKFEKYKFD